MTKLLIVDDSALMRRLLGGVFKDAAEFDVAFARDGVEALLRLHEFKPDVITLDVQMPVMDGLACLDRIMLERPCPVVMVSSLTAEGAEETLAALDRGAVDFVLKPAGAISLAMDEFGPLLRDKVLAASRARLPSSMRLSDRIRHKFKSATAVGQPSGAVPAEVKPRFPVSGTVDGIVLIGTSTGGPPALDVVLSRLPGDFRWPVLVAQHMPSTFTGPLARRLDKLCALAVMEVTGPTPLTAGYVYIGKGDADLVVASSGGTVCADVAATAPEYRWHPSVDRLVTTAMQHFEPSRMIGVLMTGMGDDGAAAMSRLKAAGGRTIAESEETAVVWGMPGELVKAGGALLELPVGKIADTVRLWVG